MNNLITRIVLSLKNRETRKQYLIMLTLYLLMFINEAYMHYEVYVTHHLHVEWHSIIGEWTSLSFYFSLT